MRYYVDSEFDGHGGVLLSMAVVREDGESIHIQTDQTATDPWVAANVIPYMDSHEATTLALVPVDSVGSELRVFLSAHPEAVIVADSPVDIARFCQAISTADDGGYACHPETRLAFEVHDVNCYPTTLPGAVQHNAWWDAMALREKLS